MPVKHNIEKSRNLLIENGKKPNWNKVFHVLLVLLVSKRIWGLPPQAKELAALNFWADTLRKLVNDTHFLEMAFDISTEISSEKLPMKINHSLTYICSRHPSSIGFWERESLLPCSILMCKEQTSLLGMEFCTILGKTEKMHTFSVRFTFQNPGWGKKAHY